MTRQFLASTATSRSVAAGRNSTLAANLAALRARVKERPVAPSPDPVPLAALDSLAAT